MNLKGGIRNWVRVAFNVAVLNKTRLEWVDYLRGIIIILVVYYHTLLGIKRSGIFIPGYLDQANQVFLSLRMPLFFILSGIFIRRSLSKKTLPALLEIKFENLLYPYFIWSIIQISLQLIFGHFTNSDRGFIDYTYIFYQPRDLDQFWYLPALFNATAIYLLVQKKFNPPAWVQLGIGLTLFFASPYCRSISMVSDFMWFYIFFAIGDALSRIFFKESSQQFFKRRLSLLLIIPLFVAVQLYYLKHDIGRTALYTVDVKKISDMYLRFAGFELIYLFVALVGCLTMFKIAFLLQRLSILRFLRVLGYHSLYIYVMHLIITGFVRIALMQIFHIHNPFAVMIPCIFFSVTLPVIFYNLFVRNNFAWFLFSYKKPRKNSRPISELKPEVIPS